MKREFSVVIERDAAGYYVASVPSLPGCHTQAKSLDKVMNRIREAIDLCLEVRQENHHSPGQGRLPDGPHQRQSSLPAGFGRPSHSRPRPFRRDDRPRPPRQDPPGLRNVEERPDKTVVVGQRDQEPLRPGSCGA